MQPRPSPHFLFFSYNVFSFSGLTCLWKDDGWGCCFIKVTTDHDIDMECDSIPGTDNIRTILAAINLLESAKSSFYSNITV